MTHQLKQAFRNPKFVVGLIIFVFMLLTALLYPLISSFGPLQYVATGFEEPGTYVNVVDATNLNGTKLNVDTDAGRLDSILTDDEKETMTDWLVKFAGIDEASIDVEDSEAFLALWQENYDPNHPQEGMRTADKKAIKRFNDRLITALSSSNITLAAENDEGVLEESKTIDGNQFVNTSDVTNTVVFPLGTDNFGSDVMTKLASSIGVSLRIGLVAGLIATLLGLTIGLVAGFVGGWIDNLLTFLTNIFTVIPSFVILILISNAISASARGPEVVAVIIGVTAWPWTARSVRSQVLSLRNRDHVNLSKLSGHSMPRIILVDILPYVASYVVMAMILQISSGILAEAQLSMLGLGPSTATTTTLGLMMNWAQQFSAILGGSWWAFIPVVISVTLITFSLNLMNTGLDQVFNPQLRD